MPETAAVLTMMIMLMKEPDHRDGGGVYARSDLIVKVKEPLRKNTL
jgi:hypothetical protein